MKNIIYLIAFATSISFGFTKEISNSPPGEHGLFVKALTDYIDGDLFDCETFELTKELTNLSNKFPNFVITNYCFASNILVNNIELIVEGALQQNSVRFQKIEYQNQGVVENYKYIIFAYDTIYILGKLDIEPVLKTVRLMFITVNIEYQGEIYSLSVIAVADPVEES